MTKSWARIILVDYKSGDYLQKTVDALALQTFPDFEAVIVDNACPEGAARRLRLPDERFRVITSPENIGFAGGSNLGANGCGAEWIATLNPDAAPDADWLAEIRETAARAPFAGMLSTTLISAEDEAIVDGFGDVLSFFGLSWRGGHLQSAASLPAGDVEVFGPCGAAAFYRSDLFKALGGLDARFFCYLEDVDLAWRARLLGERCVQARRAICRHVGSISTADDSDFRTYHTVRNTVWMILKNAPWFLLAPMMATHLAAQTYLAFRHSAGHRAVMKRAMGDAFKVLNVFRQARADVDRRAALAASTWLDFRLSHVRKQPIVCRALEG